MIRPLELHEIHRIQQIGDSFAKEAEYPGGFSLTEFCGVWAPLMANDSGTILVDEDESGNITGALGMAFLKDGFSGQPVAMEQFWYVLPDARKTRAGLNLFFAFENQGKLRKARRLVMVHLVHLGGEKLRAFYESQGYKMVEQTFSKDI